MRKTNVCVILNYEQKYTNLQSNTTLLHKIQLIKITQQVYVSAFMKPSSGYNLKGL